MISKKEIKTGKVFKTKSTDVRYEVKSIQKNKDFSIVTMVPVDKTYTMLDANGDIITKERPGLKTKLEQIQKDFIDE